MLKVKLILIVVCLSLFSNLFSQKGKDAVKTVSVANVKVNEFTALSANAAIGNTTITVAASSLNANARFTSTLTPGDLIMIIQMQGASTKLYGYAVPWQPDSTYGYIWNYATCGNYEFAEVKSVISSTQIELNCGLKYSYSNSGKSQVVRVPRYNSLTITSSGTLTTDAWNGIIGGVLVAEVNGNTVVDGFISANALGFRGGIAVGNGGPGNGNFATKNPDDGAEKGEGIGSDRLINSAATHDTLGKQCKGAPGNGGGGGNANNCGGGGGGNGGNISGYNGYGIANTTYSVAFNLEWSGRASVVSSGGGKGGYGTSTVVANPNTIGPNNIAWGSTKRPSYGGFGGRPLNYSTGKIFMGGGGGAGHMTSGQSTDPGACSGGTGGGLIYLLNYGSISGTGTISANGANGVNASGTAAGVRGIDGAGGAGAGGTIILQCNGTISSIIANANGGNGGNQSINFPAATTEGQGPGGGGSGGYIAGNGSVFTQNVNGGLYGTSNAQAFNAANEFPMNGATSGDIGTNNQTITPSFSLTASSNQTLCTNQSANVTATSTNTNSTIQWYNSLSGNSIATGTVYTTPTYTATGTYTVYAGSCPGIYRLPIIITVNAGTTITVNSPTICANQTATLTAGGATSYTWSTGPANTNTVSVSPASTTVYTVTTTTGLCINTTTAQVTVSSIPTISVPSATLCSGTSTVLAASGTATSFTWMPGSITTSTISANSNTTYTITGSNGTCTNSTTATVTVVSLPTVSVPNATICSGTSTVLAASGTATSFTWMPGSITTTTISANSNATYTITGSNGTCTNSTTATVTVVSLPTVSVPNATICSGTSTVLAASGTATSFTWMPGSITTSTISANSNTIYTITGSNGTCTNSTTATVTVVSLPTVSVPNATICSGTFTVLAVSGTVTSFTWMPGSITTSTISANSNNTYTITGSNGTCTNSTTATVTVVSLPTVSVPNATICSGTSTVLAASGTATSFTWMPGSITTSTISANSNTIYTITGSNGTCTNSTTATVSVTPNPTVVVNNQAICPSQTITLTASGASTYSWSTGAITNTISVFPSSTTIYTVTGTTLSCSNTKTVSVSVASQPTLAITGNTAICSGGSTTLTAIGTATNYAWSPGGQTTSSIVVTPTINTTYSVTGFDGVCTNSTTTSISVTPTPTLTAPSTTVCSGQTTTLTVSGATTFTWNPGNVVGSFYTVVNPTSTTTVSVIGSTGACLSAQEIVTVSIGAAASISIPSATICPGQSTTLTASPATTYTWSTGSFTNTTVVSSTITTTYSVSGTIGSCAGSGTVEVTVVPQPTISITGNTTICSGSSATLTASGASNYTWTPGGQITASIVDNPNTTTDYTITGSNGVCTNSIISTVSVTPTPTITSISDTTICTNQTATFTAGGATSFTWQPSNFVGTTYTIAPSSNTVISVIGANGTCTSSATASITIGSGASITVNSETICAGQSATLSASGITTFTWSNSSNSASITVSPASTTIYTVSGNNGSCSGTQTATVTVNAVPILTVTPNDICSGQTATLNVSGADTYTWSNGINGSSQNVSPTSTTIYTVSGTDINGCVNSSTTTVNVTATPTISINSPTICVGQTATLTATGATSFTWNTTETTATINPSPVLTTTYSVLGSDGGCSSSFTATVTVDNTLLTTYSLAVATCPSETVTLFGTGTNSATTTYTWSNGINSYSQTVAPINTTTYVVNGTSLSGCPALSGTVIVNVNSISANFSGLNSDIMTVGETLSLTDISTGATSILWEYCDGVSSSNQITIPLSDIGTCCIKLVATNASCKDSITKCVNIVNEAVIIIPNVFTPNGDSKNDVFKINSVGVKSLNCVIYDRWGLKLYEWNGINGFWDGNAKSGLAPAGTYFYIINYTDEKDKSTTEKGFLTLFKD